MELRRLEDAPSEQVRRVIDAAFGRERGPEWWQWKHFDGPWGKSIGVVAVEGERVLGVRLLLPWQVRFQGRTTLLYRAVDAATAPEAQGRGLFSLLNAALMDELQGGPPTAIFSTPNLNSRGAYRRLGWRWIGPIHHQWRVVRPNRSRAFEEIPPSSALPGDSQPTRISTDWTSSAFRWRFDARSGHSYSAGRLDEATAVWRVVRSRRNVTFLSVMWASGRPKTRRALFRAAAWSAQAIALVETAPPGAPDPPWRGLRRGGSLLSVWSTNPEATDSDGPPVYELGRYCLGLADLESTL